MQEGIPAVNMTDNAEFRELWRALVSSARARGVPEAAVEDLCGDAILKGLETFDRERGDFRGFCHVILANKVKNYWRTCRRLVGLEEEPVDDAEQPFELEEEKRTMRENIDRLILRLGSEEAEFLRTLLQVAEDTDDACVSEAARRLSLTPAHGWDLFRKIRRKVAGLEAKMMFSRDSSLSLSESLDKPAFMVRADQLSWNMTMASVDDAAFGAFVARIGSERAGRIVSLLKEEGS